MQPGKRRIHPLSRHAEEAIRLLGQMIRLGRKQHRWSETELATRMGACRATVQKIERGDPSVGIGLFFEAAVLVGIDLLGTPDTLKREAIRIQGMLALMPKRMHPVEIGDDDF